jgi:hypothetical protein
MTVKPARVQAPNVVDIVRGRPSQFPRRLRLVADRPKVAMQKIPGDASQA